MYFDQGAFGKRLRELRKEKGLSQEALAEKLNISKCHYGSIERSVRGCSIDLLLDFAELFHVSTDYLLLGHNANRDKETEVLMAIQNSLTDLIRTI